MDIKTYENFLNEQIEKNIAYGEYILKCAEKNIEEHNAYKNKSNIIDNIIDFFNKYFY